MTPFDTLLALHTPIHVCPYEGKTKDGYAYIAATDFAANEEGYDPCPTYALLKSVQDMAKALIERATPK